MVSHCAASESRQEWEREENRGGSQNGSGRDSKETSSQGTLRAAIKARRLDVLRLKSEVEEIVEGTLPLERIELYEPDELLFVAKDVTRKARTAHEKLSELAHKYEVDLTKTKALQGGHRLQYSDQDLEEKRVIGLKTHIRELIMGIRTWSNLERWEERWSKKKTVRRSVIGTPPGGGLMHAEAYPLREVAHGGYVHVPWSRGDLAAFTHTFPKLRESPVEWYKQVERFVKISKVLWIDLNTLFDIVVPSDLWIACKIACKVSVKWPTFEPERDSTTNGPSPRVMAKYEQAITWLKTKVPPQDIDWVKIDRTRQEPKETVHEYYERLLLIFKQYSGLDVMDPKDMGQFVSKFVLGLRPDICLMIQQHLICWQNKPLDEILRYARYCSDEIDSKTKKLKDKLMLVQMQAGGQGQSGNGTLGGKLAYNQVQLDQVSRHHMPFVSPIGMFQFQRMPFGLASAASFFHRIMESVLQGIKDEVTFQDDILKAVRDIQEHDGVLQTVLDRVDKAGIVVNIEMCVLAYTSMKYLGHVISEKVVEPCPGFVDAIRQATVPENKEQV
ncbi:uncharacterized protein LOC144798040 [Lissotriton helveticus]